MTSEAVFILRNVFRFPQNESEASLVLRHWADVRQAGYNSYRVTGPHEGEPVATPYQFETPVAAFRFSTAEEAIEFGEEYIKRIDDARF